MNIQPSQIPGRWSQPLLLMLKTLTLFSLLIFISCTHRQKVLLQDYNFLVPDGEVMKLTQSNDTLLLLHCYIDKPCQAKPVKHFKIVSSEQSGGVRILKLEQLDTIPMTTNPYPMTRYSILALKTINNRQLGYSPVVFGLTKQQIDTLQTNISSLKDKFFFTLFSDSYLKELSALKKITTKDEAKEITELKSEKFKSFFDSYSKTQTTDLYASGLLAEVLNQACIEKGYNPIGAGLIINDLLKK